MEQTPQSSGASGGALLIVAAAVALAWANSASGDAYTYLLQRPLPLVLGGHDLSHSVHWWINDALMTIFFFVVGLEIRREIAAGELSSPKRAALPIFAALGGMLAPAAIYLAIAGGAATRRGWGVPMATDIAFAVGVLALLGKRVPPPLRVLLLALAIVDDIGAIIVIAIFYSPGVVWLGLGLAAIGIAGVLVLQRLRVRHMAAYVLPSAIVWLGILQSGVHPTIAGVIVGLLVPVTTVGDEKRSPTDVLIARLHPLVTFVIMPVFAIANAGVPLRGLSLAGASGTIALGALAGLCVGKPLGIVGMSWIARRIGWASLPAGVTVSELLVVGASGGIGFTMAIFVGALAFDDEPSRSAAKVAVLAASVVMAVAALIYGRVVLPRRR